jgi:dienelactone hydrolase
VTQATGSGAAAAPSVAVLPAQAETSAVALLLPGGKADSFDPVGPRQLARVRMRPFASSLHRAGASSGLAVWTVRYRYRGWNGAEQSPADDARWAIAAIRDRYGDVPVALVGHSMGGRAAMRVAGEPAVVAVVGLAPWLPDGEPVGQLRGRRLLIAHGDLDVVTSPRASRRFAERAAEAGADVDYVRVRGEMHAMLRRWYRWHSLTTGWLLDAIGFRPAPARVARVIDRGRL